VRTLFTFIFALLLASLQAGLLRYLGGGAVSVSLVLPCVVYLGLFAGNVEGAIGAAAIGYLLDLLAGTPKGLMTFLAVGAFLFCRLVAGAVEARSRTAFAVLSGVTSMVVGLGALFLTRLVASAEAAPGGRLVWRMLVEALLTAVLSPIIRAAMRKLDGLFTREEAGLLR
jgi:rod shape-determining protein MreD